MGVAWMEYLDLVFGFMYQWLYLKETPSTWEIVGCCALLSTCLVNLGEEYYYYLQSKKWKNDQRKIEKENTTKEHIAKEMKDLYNSIDENEMKPLLIPFKSNVNIDSNKIKGTDNLL